MRYSGDYSFRKRIDAGMSVSEIVELEAETTTETAARAAAARRADRESQRATHPRGKRVEGNEQKSRTIHPSPKERARMRTEELGRRKRERDVERDRKRVERASLAAERSAEKAAERAKRAELSAEQRAQDRAVRAEERSLAADARRTERALPRTPRPIAHSTNAGFSRGCRCEPCVEAHREYHREYYARRRSEGIPAKKHGTPYGYQLGCKNREQCPADPTCADASLAEENRRRREQGIPERDLVPAAPVRAHIVELHKVMPYTRIGALAGVAPKDIRRLVTGRDDASRKGELAQHTDRTKAERILAVRHLVADTRPRRARPK